MRLQRVTTPDGRVSGWRRARRAFRAVVDAVAEGRIDSRYGVIVFTDRSAAP